MGKVHRSRGARAEILEIARFIARDSVDAALRWLESVDRELDLLAQFPGMGRVREELGPTIRSYPLKNYVIYYEPWKGGVMVHHVVHGARNPESLDFSE